MSARSGEYAKYVTWRLPVPWHGGVSLARTRVVGDERRDDIAVVMAKKDGEEPYAPEDVTARVE